jgi:hypothetical protein
LVRALLPWMRARVHLLAGDVTHVAAEFAASERALQEFGSPFFLAQTQLEHAEWLQSQQRMTEALPLLAEARAAFADLAAKPWLARAGGDGEAAVPATLPSTLEPTA